MTDLYPRPKNSRSMYPTLNYYRLLTSSVAVCFILLKLRLESVEPPDIEEEIPSKINNLIEEGNYERIFHPGGRQSRFTLHSHFVLQIFIANGCLAQFFLDKQYHLVAYYFLILHCLTAVSRSPPPSGDPFPVPEFGTFVFFFSTAMLSQWPFSRFLKLLTLKC